MPFLGILFLCFAAVIFHDIEHGIHAKDVIGKVAPVHKTRNFRLENVVYLRQATTRCATLCLRDKREANFRLESERYVSLHHEDEHVLGLRQADPGLMFRT